MTKKIVPTIMEKDFDELVKKLDRVKELTSWVQVDVVDGVFNFGKTFELELLSKAGANFDNLLYDLHMMVKEPINWINKALFVNATRITGQVEMMSDREDFVKQAKDAGLEAGLGFDIDTEIENIPEETDVVLLMSRKSGFEAHPVDQRIYEKIKKAKEIANDGKHHFVIGIDGGISLENIGKMAEAGADIFNCTSAIFNGNIEDNLNNLKQNANSRRDK